MENKSRNILDYTTVTSRFLLVNEHNGPYHAELELLMDLAGVAFPNTASAIVVE